MVINYISNVTIASFRSAPLLLLQTKKIVYLLFLPAGPKIHPMRTIDSQLMLYWKIHMPNSNSEATDARYYLVQQTGVEKTAAEVSKLPMLESPTAGDRRYAVILSLTVIVISLLYRLLGIYATQNIIRRYCARFSNNPVSSDLLPLPTVSQSLILIILTITLMFLQLLLLSLRRNFMSIIVEP